MNPFLQSFHSELMPTISTAGSGADRQRHLDIPPESRRRSTFANPTPAFSKSLSRLCQPNYSSTFVHQHPSPSLCMRERRTTFCNDYYDSELPRHYQWRYRRSNTLRFASRARRRNKRLIDQKVVCCVRKDGKEDMTYGCATITVVITATIPHGFLSIR